MNGTSISRLSQSYPQDRLEESNFVQHTSDYFIQKETSLRANNLARRHTYIYDKLDTTTKCFLDPIFWFAFRLKAPISTPHSLNHESLTHFRWEVFLSKHFNDCFNAHNYSLWRWDSRPFSLICLRLLWIKIKAQLTLIRL
jgi:hypothetical protein